MAKLEHFYHHHGLDHHCLLALEVVDEIKEHIDTHSFAFHKGSAPNIEDGLYKHPLDQTVC